MSHQTKYSRNPRIELTFLFSILLSCISFLATAGDLYKWQDKEGLWHFSDQPPKDDSNFDFIELPAEPRAMASMRKTGSKHNPSYEFFNHYHGPAELEVRLKVAENIVSDPPLPTRTVLPGQTERKVVTFSSDDPRKGFRFQLAYTLVPGRPLQDLPDDIDFYPPFPQGQDYPISQGFDGDTTHKGASNRYAVDIVMPVGTPVLAARGGIVMDVEDDFHGGKQTERYLDRANRIRIMHNDGSMAVYAHLQPNSARIHKGSRVPSGAWIANSGNTGFSSGPHLHFVVQMNVGLALESLPFRFHQPSGGSMTPEDVGIVSGVLSSP